MMSTTLRKYCDRHLIVAQNIEPKMMCMCIVFFFQRDKFIVSVVPVFSEWVNRCPDCSFITRICVRICACARWNFVVRLGKRVWLTIFRLFYSFIRLHNTRVRIIWERNVKKCATYIVLSLLSRKQHFVCDWMRWCIVYKWSVPYLARCVSHMSVMVRRLRNVVENTDIKKYSNMREYELNICSRIDTTIVILHGIELFCITVYLLACCPKTLRIVATCASVNSFCMSRCSRIHSSIVQYTLRLNAAFSVVHSVFSVNFAPKWKFIVHVHAFISISCRQRWTFALWKRIHLPRSKICWQFM